SRIALRLRGNIARALSLSRWPARTAAKKGQAASLPHRGALSLTLIEDIRSREPMATKPLGPMPLAMAFATLICACFGTGRSCNAAEANLPSPVHVAAAATEGDPLRPSRRNLRSEEKLELEWLLAQSTQSTASGETIIAIFPASATPTV